MSAASGAARSAPACLDGVRGVGEAAAAQGEVGDQQADEAFEQSVAIKIVREDLASSTVGARFLAERQILASLDHPTIARLIGRWQ